MSCSHNITSNGNKVIMGCLHGFCLILFMQSLMMPQLRLLGHHPQLQHLHEHYLKCRFFSDASACIYDAQGGSDTFCSIPHNHSWPRDALRYYLQHLSLSSLTISPSWLIFMPPMIEQELLLFLAAAEHAWACCLFLPTVISRLT